jgi:hypothetical protein
LRGFSFNNFSFKLNKLCKYAGLENLIKQVIPNCGITCFGLVFFPKYSGISIIHIEKKIDKIDIDSNQTQVVESKTYDLIYNFVDYLKTRTYSYEKGNKVRKFWLSKSNIPDVYNISEKENGERVDIAHIPNIKISHLCDEKVLEDELVDIVLDDNELEEDENEGDEIPFPRPHRLFQHSRPQPRGREMDHQGINNQRRFPPDRAHPRQGCSRGIDLLPSPRQGQRREGRPFPCRRVLPFP